MGNAYLVGEQGDFEDPAGVTLGPTIIWAGEENPRHRHNTCDLYVLHGRVRHSVGDESVVLEAGDALTIPAGVFHNGANIGNEDADVIVVYSTGERDCKLEQSPQKS